MDLDVYFNDLNIIPQLDYTVGTTCCSHLPLVEQIFTHMDVCLHASETRVADAETL